jgi:hypothetical protein
MSFDTRSRDFRTRIHASDARSLKFHARSHT